MHISELHKFVLDPSLEFSLRFVKKDGELVDIERCVCTSFHSAGRTMNLLLLPSKQVRKIVRHSIVAINNKPFYL